MYYTLATPISGLNTSPSGKTIKIVSAYIHNINMSAKVNAMSYGCVAI